MTDRPLPHNREAEVSVLGAILIDNKYLAVAAAKLKPHDFLFQPDRAIFREMLAMGEAQQAIDEITLTDSLRTKSQLDTGAGTGVPGLTPAYISGLTDEVPRITNVEHHAEIVAEKSRLRQLASIAQSFQSSALDGEKSSLSLLHELENIARETASVPANGNGHDLAKRYSLKEFLAEKFPEPEHLVYVLQPTNEKNVTKPAGLIPKDSTVMILALPHRLKSWFTTALSLVGTRVGKTARLEIRKPVRTMLVQLEDFPGQLQWRMQQLLEKSSFDDINTENLSVIPRCDLHLPDERWFQWFLREVSDFGADHVIIDVVRRIFRGDVNSPKETAAFLEQLDRLREATHCTVTLVHHENKKDAELMTAAAGSYNFPGWANVMIQFRRKVQKGDITYVDMEVDNKLARSPEPMILRLDLTSHDPIVLEAPEDGAGLNDALRRLGSEFTVRDLMEVAELHKTNAYRRVERWIEAGLIEKVTEGKRGRHGGLARYRAVDVTEDSSPDYPPVGIRRLQ